MSARGRRAPPSRVRMCSTTACRNVLEGMVPVSTQQPPNIGRFSTTATRFPSLALWTAARWPAGPLPMQIRS